MIYTDKQQREIFHFLFLERLLKVSDPTLYVLKGGVNLRFFFNSPRYSEDMDLDVLGGSVATLKKNGYKILEDASFQRMLQTYGIESLKINDPLKAKQTETTQRFRLRLVNVAGEEFPTKVEFSRRSSIVKKEVLNEQILPSVAKNYQRLSFSAQHYSGTNAVIQKIQALGGRAQTQARDVFDLYILFLAGYGKIETIHSLSSTKERSEAFEALQTLSYEAFQGQVLEYLPIEEKKQFESKKSWSQICEKIAGIIE